MNLIQNRPDYLSPVNQELLKIEKLSSATLQKLKQNTIQNFHTFWYNENITPAQFLEAMGTNAARVFQLHRATIDYLLSHNISINIEDYVPPVAFTIHSNGTITID